MMRPTPITSLIPVKVNFDFKLPDTQKVIVAACCKAYGIIQTEIKSKSRKGKIVQARQMAIFMLLQIAKFNCQKNVLHSFNKHHSSGAYIKTHVHDMLETDKITQNNFAVILEFIKFDVSEPDMAKIKSWKQNAIESTKWLKKRRKR